MAQQHLDLLPGGDNVGEAFEKAEANFGELYALAALISAIQDALASKQPLDADLTAIAALGTQAFGRSLLTKGNDSDARSALGLGSAALANTGALNGNVPVIGGGDKLPLSIIPSLMALGLTDSAGKLLASLMPALAITSVTSVPSQAAMLALVAQEGDVAVRTDQGIAYILSAGDPTILASWIPLPLPAGVVMMVAGLSGPSITAPQLFSALALGTAATKNVGTAAGNLVQLDANARLPAVDGSQLTNLPAAGSGPTKSSGPAVRALTNATDYITPKDLADAMAFVTETTNSGTYAPDFALGFDRTVTLGANTTLGQFTGGKDGETFVLRFVQDSTGSRTLAVNTTYWKLDPGVTITASTAAGAIDRLSGQFVNRGGTLVAEVWSFTKGLAA